MYFSGDEVGKCSGLRKEGRREGGVEEGGKQVNKEGLRKGRKK